jgi:flagellar FliL protein
MAEAKKGGTAKKGSEKKDAPPPPPKPSFMGFILGLLAATALAAGGGVFFGMKIAALAEKVAAKHEAQAPIIEAVAKSVPEGAIVKPIPPIVTSLAEPDHTWLRMEASIILEKQDQKDGDVLAAQLGEDIMAFIRTVTLAQIQGPSGFQHLREDLSERLRIRTGGRVRQILIQTLIFE